MNRCNTARLWITAALVGVPPGVLANGMRLVSQDGFATARGEAFAATADNPSAIYYNPAGITQLKGNNVRGGIYGIYFDPTFSPPAGAANSGTTYHVEDNFAAVPQLFYTFTPKEMPWGFGLGVYSPYGLGLEWPQDTGFRAVAIKGSLTYLTFNPVVALKVAPGLSLGAGVMVNYVKLDLEQGLLRTEEPFANYFRFTGDGWSVGYNVGLLWQPRKKLSFGITFRSSATVTLQGRTEFEQQPIIATTRRSAEVDFKFPLTAVFGISYRPTPKWNLEFDADYTDWSSFGTVTLHQSPPPWPVKQDIPLVLKWQPSWMYEFGVTRYFQNGWHASAGFVHNENSVPDKYYSPLAADLDRHFFSVGAGFKGKRFDCDIAYQFGYGPARKVEGSTPSSTPALASGQTADGTYKFISQAVLVTLGVHF